MRIFLVLGFILSLSCFFPIRVISQEKATLTEEPDSVKEKEHSPTKATIMSTLLPGLGQFYNKKYWKIPIIYAGFGILAYFIATNTDEYINYKCAYIESSYGNMNGSYAYLVDKYTKDELLSAREYYRRNLEISCLITALWYVLNIVDAAVDAHLYTFNITNKLSLNVEPAIQPFGYQNASATGFKIRLKF